MKDADASDLDAPLEDLIVCPVCDATYQLAQPAKGERAVCVRCHKVLIAPRLKAGVQIIAVAISVVILTVAASIFPFLNISAAGKSNSVSIIDAALSFTEGPLLLLSLLTAGFIILIPLARMILTLYVLVPVVRDKPPARHAMRAFRYSEALRPWSMAEIFAIGCAVALVKVADLATVGFGPAFWMFGCLVVLVMVQDGFMCKWSVWNSLEHPRRR
ncbi:paraquat-inducible protein A [Sulfitobacter sp. S190]|uniref:paraquat-inducible protein A n=1 Tax=Sulfitobacter sp. S190 TaxID=2867022 RepID=UPI0021A66E98|nr:paraquat-inducible protein A [Sulfitobacter sp. S190]UWR22713.1 paraquat-inducible protein A [Sulfitobacter sp. S190]